MVMRQTPRRQSVYIEPLGLELDAEHAARLREVQSTPLAKFQIQSGTMKVRRRGTRYTPAMIRQVRAALKKGANYTDAGRPHGMSYELVRAVVEGRLTEQGWVTAIVPEGFSRLTTSILCKTCGHSVVVWPCLICAARTERRNAAIQEA